MRKEAVVNPHLFDGDSIYSDYFGMFAAADFVRTERYPFGRYPIIKLNDECWQNPEESFILEPLSGTEYWEVIRREPALEFLLHPETYTKLILFMQRTGMIDLNDLIPPTVVGSGEGRFVFDSSRTIHEKNFALKLLGKFEVFEDEILWERLEKDAVAYDNASITIFAGIEFRGGGLKEQLSRIRQEGKPVDTKRRGGGVE